MKETHGKIFVYGSLRKGFHHPAYAYISRYFHLLSEAKVKGVLYDMGEYPAALPATDEKFIIGELYEINNPDELGWAMAQLDDYEGLNAEPGETPLYRREITAVITGQGEIPAWVYWFNGNVSGKPLVESGDVLAYLQQKIKS